MTWLSNFFCFSRRADSAFLAIGPVRPALRPKPARRHIRARKPRKNTTMSKTVLSDEQECDLRVEFLTQAGHPAKVDGNPAWESSNPNVAEVIPDPTNPFAVIVRRGAELGSAQISVTADADLGAGTRPVAVVHEVEVIAAEAVSANIIAGTPRIII